MIKSGNRSISYVSSHISSQASTHREKNKDFPAEKYISRYQLRDDEMHEQLNNIVNLTYIEIKRFNKTEKECEELEDIRSRS